MISQLISATLLYLIILYKLHRTEKVVHTLPCRKIHSTLCCNKLKQIFNRHGKVTNKTREFYPSGRLFSILLLLMSIVQEEMFGYDTVLPSSEVDRETIGSQEKIIDISFDESE